MGLQFGNSNKGGSVLQLGGQQPVSQQVPQQNFTPQQPPQQPFQQTPQAVPQQTQQFYTPQPPQGNGGLNFSRQTPQPQAATVPTGGGLNLSKGAKLDLTKGNPSLDQLLIGLGWDVNNFGPNSFDLDVEVFLLNAGKRVVSQNHIVFYNNLRSPDGAVIHNGDNRMGDVTGDDETVSIKLSQVSPEVERIVFTATIDQAVMKGQNFGQVANAYIRAVNQANGQEICRFNLTEDYFTAYSIIVGEIYRHNGEWKFGALGQGTTLDLVGLCQQYGAM